MEHRQGDSPGTLDIVCRIQIKIIHMWNYHTVSVQKEVYNISRQDLFSLVFSLCIVHDVTLNGSESPCDCKYLWF